MAVTAIDGQVAPSAGESKTVGAIDIVTSRVDRVADGERIIARLQQIANARPVAIIVLVESGLPVDAKSIEPLVENEVDHPRNRVGAIDRRSSTGQDLDALDQ